MNINPTTSSSVQLSTDANQSFADYSDEEIQAQFFTAIEKGDGRTYEKLHNHPAIHADVLNDQGQNFLHVAVQSENAAIALELAKVFGSVPDYLDAVDDQGYTPLMYAAERGHVDLAKALLDAGASVDIPLATQRLALADAGSDHDGNDERIAPSALQLAMVFGVDALDPSSDVQKSKEIVALFINAGADTSDALMRSIAMGWINTSRTLMNDLQADPTRAFHHASLAHLDKAASTLKFLGANCIQSMADAVLRDDERSVRAFHRTVILEDVAAAINIVAATGNTDAVRSMFTERAHYSYAIKQAIASGNSDIVKVLIEAGEKSTDDGVREAAQGHAKLAPTAPVYANDGPPNIEGFELLVKHIGSGNQSAAGKLKRSGVHEADALTYFVGIGDRGSVAILLNAVHGVDVGRVALTTAIQDNNLDLAKALIFYGVDPEKSLSDYIRANSTLLTQRLMDIGVNVSAALMHAVESKNQHAVTVLRLFGADFVDALLCAAERGNTSAAQALLNSRAVNVEEVVERALNNDDHDAVNFLLDLDRPLNHVGERV